MIKIYDDFLSKKEQNHVLDYCAEAPYKYGESDSDSTPPTGMTHDIPENGYIHELFCVKTQVLVPEELIFYRMYINCFAPREIPYFHTDGDDGVTFLYYPQRGWKQNDGGETQIYEDDMIKGIPPISNRMLMFDASLLHRATSFRDRHRFTIAVKYESKKSIWFTNLLPNK